MRGESGFDTVNFGLQYLLVKNFGKNVKGKRNRAK